MLLATVIFELVVAPKIRSLQQQLQQFIDELEADRRKRLEAKIQQKFDIYESKHIGRIVKSCYLGQLRELEKAALARGIFRFEAYYLEHNPAIATLLARFGYAPPRILSGVAETCKDLLPTTSPTPAGDLASPVA